MQTSDAELVTRCRQGDVSAFEELYREHATRLYNLARRMLDSTADAEDALQDIFLLAYRKLASFKGQSSLGTWLYRLAINHCLDRLRSRGTAVMLTMESLEAPSRVRNGAMMSTAPVGLVTKLDLERAIAQLPAGCRAAFLLHDVEGFGHSEVAEMLGVAEGTSKSQVHKARLKIREFLSAGALAS